MVFSLVYNLATTLYILYWQSARNVNRRALLESVGLLMRRLVLLMVSCPLTTSPVEEVPGVAKQLRLLPMYSAK